MSGVTQHEIASQPRLWREAASMGDAVGPELPRPGERVVFIGSGTRFTSLRPRLPCASRSDTARATPSLRRRRRWGGDYDLAVAISRSGTTTEVLEVARGLQTDVPVLALTADVGSPLGLLARPCGRPSVRRRGVGGADPG